MQILVKNYILKALISNIYPNLYKRKFLPLYKKNIIILLINKIFKEEPQMKIIIKLLFLKITHFKKIILMESTLYLNYLLLKKFLNFNKKWIKFLHLSHLEKLKNKQILIEILEVKPQIRKTHKIISKIIKIENKEATKHNSQKIIIPINLDHPILIILKKMISISEN